MDQENFASLEEFSNFLELKNIRFSKEIIGTVWRNLCERFKQTNISKVMLITLSNAQWKEMKIPLLIKKSLMSWSQGIKAIRFEHFPIDILWEILKFLTLTDLYSLSRVNKFFDNLLNQRFQPHVLTPERYCFTAAELWNMLAGTKDWISWKLFRSRCKQHGNRNIVYFSNGRKYLNVHPYHLRGIKRWLTDNTHRKLEKAKVLRVLEYFEPVYFDFGQNTEFKFGFALENIFEFLDHPAFTVLPDEKLEEMLQFASPGDHRFRLSSQERCFAMEFKSRQYETLSRRFERQDTEELEFRVMDSQQGFRTILDFEETMGKLFKELKSKQPDLSCISPIDLPLAKDLDICWKPVVAQPNESLNDEEFKLLEELKRRNLQQFYPALVERHIESLEDLEKVLLQLSHIVGDDQKLQIICHIDQSQVLDVLQ